jgi:hypothetical protein
MLSYQEMIAVVDRHYHNNRFDVVGIRSELESNWGLDQLQAQQVLWAMKDKGLLGWN